MIDTWELYLLRTILQAEIDTGTPPEEFHSSVTLRQVADRLGQMTPDQYDLHANTFVVGRLASVVCFGMGLARALDRIAPPE